MAEHSSIARSLPKDAARCPWTEARARFKFGGICVLILTSVGWPAWFYPFDDLLDRSDTPLGGDYVMLYVAGQTILDGQAHSLYDDAANQQRTAALFPRMNPDQSWPYRYPPTVAVVMATLARLSFPVSFAVFFCLQLGLLAAALLLLRRETRSLHSRVQQGWIWALAGAPVIAETLIGGQSSLLALVVVAGYVALHRRGRLVAAGGVLALGCYKPNVLALFMLGCVIHRPRVLLGMIPTMVAGAGLAWWCVGTEGLMDYLHLGSRLATSAWTLETPFWKVHGLAPTLQMALPHHGKAFAFGLGAIASLFIAMALRRKRVCFEFALGLLLLVNSLLNPYVPIYDLVLLLPAALFLTDAIVKRGTEWWTATRMQVALAVLFVGPHLSQAVAPILGVQLLPFLLIAIGLRCVVSYIRADSTVRFASSAGSLAGS